MLDARTLLCAAQQADGSCCCEVPEQWLQGRTVYGGLATAMAYRAARGVDAALPPLRSAQLSFVGPAAGRLHARARLLRRGRSSAFVETRVGAGDDLAALGTFLFLADRSSPLRIDAPAAPPVPPPEAAQPAMRGKGSAFSRQMEYRHAMARDGRGRPELLRWVRLREREGLDCVTELLLIADALPPGVAPMLQGPFAASSANWTLHLHGGEIDAHDGWWLVQTRAESAVGGISNQLMAVWNRAGEAVLSGSQTVSFFPAQA